MDHAEPKTRKESKGGKKHSKAGPYSQKRVRQLEALQERRPPAAAAAAPAPKK